MLNTSVIRDLLSKAEIESIAHNYFALPAIKPSKTQIAMFRQIVYFSLDHYLAIWDNPTIEYVDYQPYETADNMRDSLKRTCVLEISTQYNNPHSLLSKETNLLFRTVHDLHHCSTGSCNFELWGEICAYSKFAYDALEQCEIAKVDAKPYLSFLTCEIVGQLCALRVNGEFPIQRLSHCVPHGIIERFLHAYR
jgi:hypothetical protein